MEKPTQEQLNRWYEHKSNKERWCEAQERMEDEKFEDTNPYRHIEEANEENYKAEDNK